MTVSPIRDVEGRVYGASTFARDITQRILLEERMQDAMRIKSEIFYIVSHKLGTALTVIRGGLDRLSGELGGGTERGEPGSFHCSKNYRISSVRDSGFFCFRAGNDLYGPLTGCQIINKDEIKFTIHHLRYRIVL